MNRVLVAADLGEVDARRWPALAAGLLAGGGPVLACARLTGGAIALGRWQRAATVLTPKARALSPVRRVTGGRAIALGEGLVAVALVLPHRGWLVAEELPASRLLNRAVRGVLSGLGRLGVGATYFGRDYVTAEGGQAGYLAFDVDRAGRTLVECFVAAEAHWSLPSDCDALPPRAPVRGVPGPAQVRALAGRSSGELLDALAAGHAERFGVSIERASAAVAEGSAPREPEELPGHSRLHEVPAGFVEAQARVAGGLVERASFHGDFLADSAGLEALEEAVRGARPELEALAPRMNAVYADAGRTIMGLDDLSVLATALLEAAG